VALACVFITVVVVGQRSLALDENLPDEELRALRYAMEEEGVGRQLEISTRLSEAYPEHAWVQVIHGTVLMRGERWSEAVLHLREVEEDWPEYVAAEPYFDNDVAWALFRGHPEDKASVTEGLRRVRRNLAADRSSHALQNTLALGLYLDGQYRQAERALSSAMTAAAAEERGSDVYLDVLIQLALERPAAARERYERAALSFPEGEFRAEAESALAEAGLLEPARDPTTQP
jgi:tetratricopeptide (TPR) repeat protein